MSYEGVKFTVEFISSDVPQDLRLDELKKWCKIFHEKNLAPPYPDGSYGNLSFRVEEKEFIITGSKIGLKDSLTNGCFVKVDFVDFETGKVFIHGIRDPSSEAMLHSAIYNKREDVNAIFHGHSPEILANSSKLKIPETKKEEPYGTIELVDSVLDILDDEKFIIMKNHGFIALGETMEEAGEKTLEIYKSLTE